MELPRWTVAHPRSLPPPVDRHLGRPRESCHAGRKDTKDALAEDSNPIAKAQPRLPHALQRDDTQRRESGLDVAHIRRDRSEPIPSDIGDAQVRDLSSDPVSGPE